MIRQFLQMFSGLKRWQKILILFIIAYIFRLFFGLCSEFWATDEIQVYLLGLKFYTTGEWPYFGPDVVYTDSQIPGALLPLLVGAPFYILPIPESPFILLNILSLLSLCLLSWYCSKRTPEVPKWFIWSWILTAPWTLHYSTQMLNPSYVLPGAVLFFIGVMESYPFLSRNIIPLRWANFMMGISLFWIFQLHMSWMILTLFLLASLYLQYRSLGKKILYSVIQFVSGALLSIIFVLPTFIKYGFINAAGGTGSNIQFNPKNLLGFFNVLARFLSFASFEVPRFIGSNKQVRIEFLTQNLWVTPFAVFVGIIGIVQPIILVILWFSKKHSNKDWREIKYFTLFTMLVVYLSFTFSVKGPSSHTFYVVFPVAMIYSFYCWSKFFKSQVFRKFAVIFLLCGVIFHMGLAISKAPERSLYKNRHLVKSAIEKKDYRILGERRLPNR